LPLGRAATRGRTPPRFDVVAEIANDEARLYHARALQEHGMPDASLEAYKDALGARSVTTFELSSLPTVPGVGPGGLGGRECAPSGLLLFAAARF
jgi:hypothetical protein